MQPNAKHQEDDADFGQLQRQVWVSDKPRRERPDGHSGQQITHQRRKSQPVGDHAQEEGQSKAEYDGGNKRRL
jgi:hypothetical protein